MELNHRRRKACDLCYTRKLKCDAQKPRCSNCVVYQSQCTHVAESRLYRPSARGHAAIDQDEIRTLRNQVAQLQAQLDKSTAQDANHRSLEGRDPPNSRFTLPPREQVMPMVESYLKSHNSVLPLFRADKLRGLLNDCYSRSPRQRDPVAWAAINVVLALANQQLVGPEGNGSNASGFSTEQTDKFLSRAQSVLSAIMLGEIRLLNIQVLVGMVMVLEGAHDPTEALILISATLRLAHKLGLHKGVTSAHLDPADRKHHSHVFWLAYILDKDLSLRAQQPFFQSDEEIGVDLPVEGEEDTGSAGFVVASDGSARINYLLARVQLANIEGVVFSCLYSARASKRSLEERNAAAAGVMRAIREWQAALPPAFGASTVMEVTSYDSANLGFFCILHSINVRCMTLVNRAHPWDYEWADGVRSIMKGSTTFKLPNEWEIIVGQARDYMCLFEQAWSKTAWYRWIVTCPYTSSMVLLMVNNLRDIHHFQIMLDIRLAETGLEWLTDAASEQQRPDVNQLRDTCAEIVHHAQQRRAISSFFGQG